MFADRLKSVLFHSDRKFVLMYFLSGATQVSGGGDGGGPEHACGSTHRPCALWGSGAQEVAV